MVMLLIHSRDFYLRSGAYSTLGGRDDEESLEWIKKGLRNPESELKAQCFELLLERSDPPATTIKRGLLTSKQFSDAESRGRLRYSLLKYGAGTRAAGGTNPCTLFDGL